MPHSQLPGLLKRLASLTAVRDTELLELSLLRTLLPMLGVSNCLLYRVNERHEFLRAIQFGREVSADGKSRTQLSESIEDSSNTATVPDPLQAMIETIRETLQPAFQSTGDSITHVYPLFSKHAITGYLVFESAHKLDESEDLLVRGILSVYRNFATLLDESQRDKLTGLLNRHSLDQSLDKIMISLSAAETAKANAQAADTPEGEEKRNQKQPPTYWLAMIDIDHFKRINDTFGHTIGDEVLLLIARLMQQTLRNGDLLYRYGGEEFIAISATHDAAAIHQQLERLRQTIETSNFSQVGRFTVSIGYARLDGHYSAREIISRADQTLYEAKRAGRNKVLSHAALLAAGVLKEPTYGSIELF
ncbi:GGDEF domain-containing protein [Chitinimonas sp. BJB300]|uniref:GGDEF domain-containing protein n=1 Tax=Chitinimonas sp. BJB300 TaxID=1559339 RepID=UPI000C0D7B17|nr:GGDEF domain-containing protein [Chitinimonas sp. BJB300]PHV13254.1 GGDEF domain-containing protein [Chitinimonas sp. BJB300]TSJ89647.1 GGDEF domain-containing protein [Chitinimonas sp. BJB300]